MLSSGEPEDALARGEAARARWVREAILHATSSGVAVGIRRGVSALDDCVEDGSQKLQTFQIGRALVVRRRSF